MKKEIKITVDIPTLVEFDMNGKERLELIDYILYSLSTNKELNKFTKKFLDDLLAVEMEYEKREDVINAIKLVKLKVK